MADPPRPLSSGRHPIGRVGPGGSGHGFGNAAAKLVRDTMTALTDLGVDAEGFRRRVTAPL
jgi:hypothetical protein